LPRQHHARQGAPLRLLTRQKEIIPIKDLAAIPPGAKLIWDPVRLPPRDTEKAEIAILIVPRGGGKLVRLR
jgi:hypothetical protein